MMNWIQAWWQRRKNRKNPQRAYAFDGKGDFIVVDDDLVMLHSKSISEWHITLTEDKKL